jgi:prepilin-type N-terminal cleavage/methylation domain-containing protein/prepilin-type processing-associated H-X9-DG protein
MKMHSPSAGRRNPAFTLIELLTAVAIVSILAALVSTGLVRMRKTASQAGCLNNLRQIGVAWHQYLADNNRTFPEFKGIEMYGWGGRQGTWTIAGGKLMPPPEERPLYPYLPDEKAFQCPSDVHSGGRLPIHKLAGNSYAMAPSPQRGILKISPENAGKNRQPITGVFDRLQKPSSTIMVFEHSVRASEPGYKSNPTASQVRRDWHPNDTSNILMADGHVETFQRAALDASPHPLNPPGYTWGWSGYTYPGLDW